MLGFAGENSEERTWEEIAAVQPDIVIVMPCGYDAEIAHREAEMHRDELAAVGAGEVVAVDAVGLLLAARAADRRRARAARPHHPPRARARIAPARALTVEL